MPQIEWDKNPSNTRKNYTIDIRNKPK
jgi:hypothetical protein